jgi:hypothetical protein
MRYLIAICVLATTSILVADEPNSPSNSKLSQLGQAVQLLEQAGESELAEQVRQRMGEQQQASRERLIDLQKQRDELTREIDRLKQELEQVANDPAKDRPAVLLHVNMLRVDLERLQALHPELAEKLVTKKDELPSIEAVDKLVDLPNPPESDEPLFTEEVSKTLRLPLGEIATSFSGGNIRIPISATGHQILEVGTHLTAYAQPTDEGDFYCELHLEHSTADYGHAVKAANGSSIPRLTKQAVQKPFQAKLKEPRVIASLANSKNQLMLVTILLEPDEPAAKQTP